MRKQFLLFAIIVSILASCSALEKITPDTETSPKPGAARVSLSEFTQSLESEEELNFVHSNQPKDYSNLFESYASSNNSKLISDGAPTNFSRPKIKFKWSGINGKGGCETPLGICIILFGGGASADIQSNSVVTLYKGKLIIEFSSDDNGLTRDGYLPLFDNVPIDKETATELGLVNPKIKAGIYKAYYDPKLAKYRSVIVDLI